MPQNRVVDESNEFDFPIIGDMGGYMGLLLGASAMTVVELLDLIIYNCVRKCRDRNDKTGRRNGLSFMMGVVVDPLQDYFQPRKLFYYISMA